MTQPLPCHVSTHTTGHDTRLSLLCEPWRRTDQRGQAPLPSPLPGMRESIPVADEQAPPSAAERGASHLRAMGVHLAIRDRRVCQAPQPLPSAVQPPRGLVHGVDQRGACDLAHGGGGGRSAADTRSTICWMAPVLSGIAHTERPRSCPALRLAPTMPALSPTQPV